VSLEQVFDLEEELPVGEVSVVDVTGDDSPEILFSVAGGPGTRILAVEGRGGRPVPAAGDFIGFNSRLNPGLATTPLLESEEPGASTGLIAGLAPIQGRIVAWTLAGQRIENARAAAIDATTPPAIGEGYIAYGGGAAHLARVELDGAALRLARAFDSPPVRSGDLLELIAGNVLVGPLLSEESLEVVYSTESGRLHVATTDGAVTVPSGPDSLQVLGSSPGSVGLAPLKLVAANFLGTLSYQVAAVDSRGHATLLELNGTLAAGWPVDLPAPAVEFPAAGDIDGDGAAELVAADTLGLLHVLNGDGSSALGFPFDLGSKAVSGPVLAELDGNAGAEIFVADEAGSLHGVSRGGARLPGFPLAVGRWAAQGPFLSDMNADGRLDIVGGSMTRFLPAWSLLDRTVPETLLVWSGPQGGARRNAVLDRRLTGSSRPAAQSAELICFPNPARGKEMHFRVTLRQGQSARADVFDLLGRRVAADLIPRSAGLGESDIRWPLDIVSPGVYLVRVKIDGPRSPGEQWRTVSVLK
jgi:hypothetical protein